MRQGLVITQHSVGRFNAVHLARSEHRREVARRAARHLYDADRLSSKLGRGAFCVRSTAVVL
jgi:hypothetical protein